MMKPKNIRELNSNSYVFGVKENLIWIPINDLDKYNTYPKFLNNYLQAPHKHIEHIVSYYE